MQSYKYKGVSKVQILSSYQDKKVDWFFMDRSQEEAILIKMLDLKMIADNFIYPAP